MMVICAIIGCKKNSKKKSNSDGVSFYRLPAVITHQGDRAKELSQRRRELWLARILRTNLDLGPEKYPNTRICSLHFVSGKLLESASHVY